MSTTTDDYTPLPDAPAAGFYATVTINGHTYQIGEEIMWGSQCWEIAHIHRNRRTGQPWFEATRPGHDTAAIDASDVYPYAHTAMAQKPGHAPKFPCQCAETH